MSEKAFEEEFEDVKKEVSREDKIRERRRLRQERFPPISIEELDEILSLTIKKDRMNKIVALLCCASAYTEDSQLNVSFNAPSSTGKSYIPLEISSLFPQGDLMKVGYCSPAAFFHDTGVWDGERKCLVINLERRILIFLDQPHNKLLHRLRPLLSHDQKEIRIKITDKTEKRGLRTKNVLLRGFPAVIFCTAGLSIDEQEATRLILLSPETTQEKIRQGIDEAIFKGCDPEGHRQRIVADPKRKLLIERLEAIKEERVKRIVIFDRGEVARRFYSKRRCLKPRHQRDIKHLMSIVKSFALLNLWHRETAKDPRVIVACEEDVSAAFQIWEQIALSQDLNLPPYVLSLFKEVIVSLYDVKQRGLKRNEILEAHLKVYGRPLDAQLLGREIIPMLERSGLIVQDQDPDDKRYRLVTPVSPETDSGMEAEN
jgi:hypothetical protein